MIIRFFFLFILLQSSFSFAQKSEEVIQKEFEKTAEKVLGTASNEKFSFHRPTYAVFGERDLKLQFSFKYRLAPAIPFYLAYTQLFFWKIYDESKPFAEVNYNPEFFYRLFDKSGGSFTNLDMGWMHLSNGKDKLETRSLDRIYLRSTYLTKLKHHNLNFNLMIFQIYNEDETNTDIVNHLGHWELNTFMSNLIRSESGQLAFEGRVYAGSKVIDLDQGAYQVGLLYIFNSSNFNPSIYLQRFEGYSESLLGYNKKRALYRLGLSLTF